MLRKTLSKKRKKDIKRWLKESISDKSTLCPFSEEKHTYFLNNINTSEPSYCAQVCQELFPKMKIVSSEKERKGCPCCCSSVKYVTRRAKEFLNMEF